MTPQRWLQEIRHGTKTGLCLQNISTGRQPSKNVINVEISYCGLSPAHTELEIVV